MINFVLKIPEFTLFYVFRLVSDDYTEVILGRLGGGWGEAMMVVVQSVHCTAGECTVQLTM